MPRDGYHWRYEAFRGTVGDSELAGTIDVETDRERPLITADLVSEELDIGEETLDLRVFGEPKALEIAGARVPIEIGGRFSAPEVAIDPDGIAVRGALGLALGALLAPLAAIVPRIELGLAEDGDCREWLEDIELEVTPE